MVECPVCDGKIDVDEEEVDEGETISCDECGAALGPGAAAAVDAAVSAPRPRAEEVAQVLGDVAVPALGEIRGGRSAEADDPLRAQAPEPAV